MKAARALVFSWALLASACLDTNFDPPYLVKYPDILAIRAEPPEVAFGEDVIFETMLVDGDGSNLAIAPGVELRFMVCMSVAAVVSASGLGFGTNLDDNCGEGGDDLVRLETGGDLPPGTARLPGSSFARLIEGLSGAGGGGGGGGGGGEQAIDPNLLRTLAAVIAEVGVPLRMRLEVWRDGEQIIVGFKRFAIAQREDVTTNPPPPRFAVGGVWLSARGGGDPHVCVAEDGAVPVVETRAEITMSPDPDEEEWIETYPVVGLDGSSFRNEESAYYSWFSTAGAFSAAITQRPERDATYTAPEEAGAYPLWVVVRDGHLGMSYCRTELTVVSAE